MQKIDLIKNVALNLRDLVVDATPASLTGSTLDFARLIHPLTGQLKGQDVYIYSGAGAGQSRIISEFTPANNRCEFAQVFASIPSVNSSCFVFDYFHKDEYDNAIERMMGRARMKFLQEKVATLTLVATQYEYPVPSGMETVFNLRLVPSTGTDYQSDDYTANQTELPPRYWGIEPNVAGTYLIIIDPRKVNLSVFDKHYIKVLGQGKPDSLGTDNATVPNALEEYIIAGATARLAANRIKDSKDGWSLKFADSSNAASDLENYISSQRYGKEVGR